MRLERTNSNDPDFCQLVTELDEYLSEVDGDEHAYFAQFNGLEEIANVVVVYAGEEPVGCGAFKRYSNESAEIKRMFVRPDHRGSRIGAIVLEELERWAGEAGFTACILETGHKQEAAVRLYLRSGYKVIPNYDQYVNVASSVCMKKDLMVGESVAV